MRTGERLRDVGPAVLACTVSCVLVVYGCSGELRPRSREAHPTVTEIKRVYEVAKPKAPPAPPATSVAKADPKPAKLERGMHLSTDARRELRALAFFAKPERVAAPNVNANVPDPEPVNVNVPVPVPAPDPAPPPKPKLAIAKPAPKPPEPIAMRDHEDTDELPLPEPRRPAAKAKPIELAKVEPPKPKPKARREPEPDPAPVAVAPPPPAPPPPPTPVLEAPPPEPAVARKVEHRPKRPTPMSPQQATHHLMLAWEKVTGEEATLEVVSVFWGQWALETGRGRWMVDYNYAGLKGVAPDGGWAYWWTWEEAAGGPHRVRARFRNYETADRGAEDYVRLLSRMYPKAVLAAREGNAGKFIDELVDGGFFTEIPKHYKRSVVSLAAEFRRDTRALRL